MDHAERDQESGTHILLNEEFHPIPDPSSQSLLAEHGHHPSVVADRTAGPSLVRRRRDGAIVVPDGTATVGIVG